MEVGMRRTLDKFGLGDMQAQDNYTHATVKLNENEAGPSGHFNVQW